MKPAVALVALAGCLASAAPAPSADIAPSEAALSVWYLVLADSYKDSPDLAKRDVPSDAIKVRVSDADVASIKARTAGVKNPDLILAPVYLTSKIQEE